MIGLAIDLGGSHAVCAAVKDDGSIVASRKLPADGSAPLLDLLPQFSDAIRQLLASAGVSCRDCSGLAFGFCGIVSPRDQRVISTSGKFKDAVHLDLAAWCKREFGLPFLLENDARLALLGEHRFGAARGVQDAVMVTLGSGIGAAALLNHRLLESRHGLAGTIGGHLPVALDGRLCSCGNRGCAEAEASTAYLTEIYRVQTGADPVAPGAGGFGFANLFQAADAGDHRARAVLDHCLRVWSVLTVALIHAYDPEVVVFGGSVLKRAADILPRLQEYVRAHAWTPGRVVPLRPAELGLHAALLGAIPLIEASH